jgi:hypothetical protein
MKLITTLLLKTLTRSAFILVALSIGVNQSVYADIITCTTADAIDDALNEALPGDTIQIESGTYTGTSFKTGNAGTALLPIVIESLDSTDQATLSYGSTSSGTILEINHEYWVVRNLKLNTGNKGIVLDAASYSIVNNVTVDSIGQEAIHVINGSSNVQILNCTITNTGTVENGYGEGVYVGSDYTKWIEEGGKYAKECDDVLIKACTIGPDVRAEHIDIKEGTLRTIVEDCIFNGEGMTNANYASSFIDVKGDSVIVRNNTGYRHNNSNIIASFENHVKNNWGNTNLFCSNYVEMDISSIPIVDVGSGKAYVSNNTGSPTPTEMYDGNYEEISIDCENPRDCEGILFGTAYIDDCGACAGGNTGHTANTTCEQDCYGDWGGTAAIDQCNVCSGGNTGIAIDDCALSTNTLELNTINLYPNPTTGILYLKESSSFKVTTITGIQVLEGYNNSIDLSAKPAGLYIVFINGKYAKVIKK